MKLKDLQKYDEDLEIWIESHCGQINDCVGIIKKDGGLLLCNEEGYAQKELKGLTQSNNQSNNQPTDNTN